ncbi:FUSC family protein [Microbacterium indicum]|uniref:FUSC family protein n=1 Tax=Microbacterium indicum TaxID=358100 RepID=UPI0003F62803|nr:FUSC family protein [Microbacterium indicum]
MTNRDPHPTSSLPRVRPRFDVWPSLRGARVPRDNWWVRSLTVLVTGAVALAGLAIAGHVEWISYTLPGTMVAIFGHALPYRQRIRTMTGYAILLTLGCGLAMAVAVVVPGTLWRILVASLLATVIKVAHEASRVGPPSVIPVFLVTALVFTPQEWATLPLHTGLVAAGAVIALAVLHAPALRRPHGPERRAVATAVLAAIPLHEDPSSHAARDALAIAIANAARMSEMAKRTPELTALEEHIISAERVLSDPSLGSPERARADARAIERDRDLPEPLLTEAERRELDGVRIERASPHAFAERHRILAAFHPRSASMPFFWRTLVGTLAAALISFALGADRPFWAITTVAVILQPTLQLTWRKAPARAVGALLGVGAFALLAPLARTDVLVTALLIVVLGAAVEAFIVRNYVVGQLLVTPMALLISELGSSAPVAELTLERLVDTVVGVVVALAVSFLIRNRHVRLRARAAVDRLDAAVDAAEQLPATTGAVTILRTRRELVRGLGAVASSVRDADGEWWSPTLDRAHIIAVRRRAHQALADLPRSSGSPES